MASLQGVLRWVKRESETAMEAEVYVADRVQCEQYLCLDPWTIVIVSQVNSIPTNV